MNKDQIIQALQEKHQEFIDYIRALPVEDFMFRREGKWTAGQQIEHIVKAISPVAMALGLPRIVPFLLFGKSNRPSKTYDGLVEKYKYKLATGGKASGRFVPNEVQLDQREKLCNEVNRINQKLCDQVAKIKEEKLDVYILPHPLLGKLTFREMLYFTIYHVEHHHTITKRDMGK